MTSLAAIGIVSRDIAESCRFYRILGLDVPEPADGEQHFEITLPNGLRLMWDAEELIRQHDPQWKRPEGHGLALAFECKNVADVNETYSRVTGAGFTGKKEPYDAFWGQRYGTVADPDGNVIDLFAPL
jgi:uncharacterized glyoxalase superfamily protein PhnB